MTHSVSLVGTALLLGALCTIAAAKDEAFYRPQADVGKDPPAFWAADLFTKMPPPGPHDWMAAHPEPPQSFRAYVASRPVRATPARHTLVVAPVGPMTAEETQRLAVLHEFLGLYYALPARLGPALPLRNVTRRDRTILDRPVTQYLTGDILHKVLAPALPPGAVCLQGVAMVDLYPDDSWNYVFGQASLRQRVGIYSLIRFQATFWGKQESPAAHRLALRRSLQTLVHETGHMFGVHHCQTYECVMNGSNHLAESDARPIHLCPECLKKFRWNLGFDVIERYEALRTFYATHGLTDEAAWVAKRLVQCRKASAE